MFAMMVREPACERTIFCRQIAKTARAMAVATKMINHDDPSLLDHPAFGISFCRRTPFES